MADLVRQATGPSRLCDDDFVLRNPILSVSAHLTAVSPGMTQARLTSRSEMPFSLRVNQPSGRWRSRNRLDVSTRASAAGVKLASASGLKSTGVEADGLIREACRTDRAGLISQGTPD